MVSSGFSLDALTSGALVAPSSWQSTPVDVVAIGGGDVGFVDAGCSSLDVLLPQPARANARTMSAADRFTTSSLLSLEAALYLPEVERVDLDHLRPAPLPADDSHRARRHLEHGCQQADERIVRPPALGRSGHAHLPAAAVPSDKLGPRRARGDGDANPSR
jgi:hypothetical protein